jgi:hypothetical protein
MSVLRLRGRCIAYVPRSPDVTRNSDGQIVRLSLGVSDCGHVGRPSPMATVTISKHGYGYAIVDGARPPSRRMYASLQYPKADQSG